MPDTEERELDATDPIVSHFRNCLQTRRRSDGNVVPVIAKGDCTMMLQLVRMKLDNFGGTIDRRNPGRFRGTKQLVEDIQTVVGNGATTHVPKWGASHFRGTLRDDDKRGNKRHIIAMIDKLNGYEGQERQLRDSYQECIRQHQAYWDSFSLTVEVQQQDEFQTRLLKLLDTASLGRVQQGIVYSTLKRRHGDTRKVTTKKTFAGDDQSSQHGELLLGDVQVWLGESVEIALEVKDAVVDPVVWSRVESTHGTHEHALFLLGTEYSPRTLQHEISNRSKTYAVHLSDFLMTLVFMIASDEGVTTQQVLNDIVTIYNDEFCEQIEKDHSIRIELVER